MDSFTFTPLTPTAFLDRAALVFRDRVAIADGELRFTYGQFHDRSRRLAGALRDLGVGAGDRVAALCVNSHVMLELHNGVPYLGAVLVPLNIRLSAEELGYAVSHSGASILIASQSLADKAAEVTALTGIRTVVAGVDGEYEDLLSGAAPMSVPCVDEKALLAISYTSGTTGRPKGVMYHHRGAYLQSLAMAFHLQLSPQSKYLWTLPQFHCNGWCFTWAVTAAGGTHVCLPAVDAAAVWRLIRIENITHFCAAPTVLTMIVNDSAAAGQPPAETIRVGTGGAPPSPTLLTAMAELRMEVTHLYGLTETFGPLAVNQWHPEWDALPAERRSELRSRQGVGNVVAERLRVVDDTGTDVPADGQTHGRVLCRGNDVMLGYYRDDAATREVNLDGWFVTGDLGVHHPDGYVELKDREKDIIISGGENIASVEIERVLDAHPAVLESAVVGRPDALWGEVPVAFVELHPSAQVNSDELVELVRARLAHFKAPKEVIYGELPKTSTGKIQKNLLRLDCARPNS